MLALIRFGLANMLHAQRYLAPVVLFLTIMSVGTINSQGPLAPLYALASGAVFLCSAWLTVILINADDPTHRAITIVAAGRARTVLISLICVSGIGCLVLSAIGLVFPLIVGRPTVTGLDLLVGVGAELTCALTGIAIGLLCSRLVVPRPGYSLLAALGMVLGVLVVPYVPPVNPMFRLMSGGGPAADMVLPVVGFACFSVVLLVLCAVVAHFVATRRE